MLAAVARLFPSQSLFVNYKYSGETQMFTRDQIISRQCGSIQGDPHGGLCFDAVFQGVLERAAEAGAHPSRELCSAFAHPADATPSLHIVAVHDDTWFCGPPAEAIAALHFCASPAGFRSIGGNMKLNFAKCLVYAPALDRWSPPYARSTLEEALPAGMPIDADLMPILGLAIGKDPAVRAWLQENKMTDWSVEFPRLISANAQSAALLLRFCITPQLVFSCRALSPQVSEPIASFFDTERTRCWHSIVQRELQGPPDELTFQPLRNSGEGMRLFARILPLTHFSSLMASLPLIRMVFPEVEDFLRAHEEFFDANESLEGLAPNNPMPLPLIQLQNAYNAAVTMFGLAPEEAPPILPSSFELLCAGFYARLAEDRRDFKLQHSLTRAFEDQLYQTRVANSTTADTVRNLSKKSYATTCLFTTLPTEPGLYIPDKEYRIITNFLHGRSDLPPDAPCPCGKAYKDVHHVLGCKKYRGLWWRHDSVTCTTSQLCAEAGLPTQTELIVGDGQNRIDVQTRQRDGTLVYCDVSCVHPLSISYVRNPATAATQGHCALTRATAKKSKWTKVMSRNNITAKFVPLVFESYGLMGKEFRDFLKGLASSFTLHQGIAPDSLRAKRVAGAWYRRAVALIAVSAQLGNAMIIDNAANLRSYPQRNHDRTAFKQSLREGATMTKLQPFAKCH